MADISISKSRGKKYLGGASPMVPAFIVGDDPIPLNPPGSGGGGSFFGVGAGLSLDDTQKVQFGKIEGTDPSVVYVDLQEYTSNPLFILATDYDSYYNTGADNYGALSIKKDDVDLNLYKTISGDSAQITAKDILGDLTAWMQVRISSLNSRVEITSLSMSVIDEINSKGLIYASDYEANFTARSLVTKQYVDGAISGAGHLPVTIGSPANGLSISGTQVLSIGLASSIAIGALSSTDWSTFNGKLNLTSLLTGYVVGANIAISDTNTILTAFQQVQGQINARVSGTIASGQVAFGTGINTVGGDSGLVWDNTNKILLSSEFRVGNISLGVTLNPFIIRDIIDPSNPLVSATRILPLTTNKRLFFGGTGANFYSIDFDGVFNDSAGGFRNTPRISFKDNVTNGGIFFGGGDNVRGGSGSRIILSGFFGTQYQSSAGNIRALIGYQTGTANELNSTFVGMVHIGSNNLPTNTLDVNGTARIRTISNGIGDFLTKSATGVITSRTAAQTLTDIGGLSSSSLSIASGQVAFGTGVNTVGGDAGLTWNNTSNKLQLGNLTSLSTSTPVEFNQGGTYADQPIASKAKWKFYDDGTPANIYGIGISLDKFNFFKAAFGGIGGYYWYFNNVEKMRLTEAVLSIPINELFAFAGSAEVTVNNYAISGNTTDLLLNGPGAAGKISFRVNNNNICQVDNSSFILFDAKNLAVGTTTGTKIGTATTQKLSFWNKTPIIQPTTAYASSVLVSLGGTTITDTDTFDGYTLKQIVSALRGIGLLA